MMSKAQMEKMYTFSYPFNGSMYGLQVYARSPEEARKKVRAMACATYDGEVVEIIPVAPIGFTKWALSKLSNIVALWRYR